MYSHFFEHINQREVAVIAIFVMTNKKRGKKRDNKNQPYKT